MNKSPILFFLLTFSFLYSNTYSQDSYRSYEELTLALQQLEADHSGRAQLESIATSPGGHEIWKLTIGTGEIESKPALAVVGGVDGAHILGIELALKAAESLLNNPDYGSLVQDQVFHIFPNLNPDASEQFFSSLQYERSVNAREMDLDRDGRTGEDGFDDLNGDGMITMMRMKDATGEWIPHPDDPRIMVKADPLKGEKGRYLLFTEGIDQDNDGDFNEDPQGGVNLNRNFTYQHPSFESGAGEYPLSEAENRALLDLLYDSFHVYAVLTFGPNNNLSDPWSYNRSRASQRVITSILEEDAGIFRSVSDLFKEIVPQDNASGYELQKGGFAEWAYFHYARYSFTSDGWWVPEVKSENGGNSSSNSRRDDDGQVNFLQWTDREGYDLFVDWQVVDHPDFPDREVEVGGIKPYAMSTPPYGLVDSLNGLHLDFMTRLAEMRPDLVFENIRVEDAGRDLTRITIDLHNRGHLPTSTALGTRTLWVRPLNVSLDPDDSLHIVSGRPRFQIDRLEGGSSQRLTWLLRGRGSITVTAGTPSAGIATHQQSIR